MLVERNSCTIISKFKSAEQFLIDYPEVLCDLLLLDIEMGDMSGMELAKELRANGDTLPIIFSEYIGDGYDVEALHYLLKPVDKKKLFRVLDRYACRRKSDSRIILLVGEESVLEDFDDIVYLEAFGKKTQITLNGGKEIACTCGLGTVLFPATAHI